MERSIEINVIDKVAYAPRDALIICDNADYTVTFKFDDEWDDVSTKTARFYTHGKYTDIVFSGNTVKVPAITKAAYVMIGVFAESITTTPTFVRCEKSILSEGGAVAAPSEDVYNQIISMIDDLKQNGVTSDQIASAVEEYFVKNPISAGYVIGNGLKLDEETNTLSVDAATEAEPDNTLPITSAAVHATIGNINALLETI